MLAMQAAVATLPATLLLTAIVSSLIINLLRITIKVATHLSNLETSRLKEDTTMVVAASKEMIVWMQATAGDEPRHRRIRKDQDIRDIKDLFPRRHLRGVPLDLVDLIHMDRHQTAITDNMVAVWVRELLDIPEE